MIVGDTAPFIIWILKKWESSAPSLIFYTCKNYQFKLWLLNIKQNIPLNCITVIYIIHLSWRRFVNPEFGYLSLPIFFWGWGFPRTVISYIYFSLWSPWLGLGFPVLWFHTLSISVKSLLETSVSPYCDFIPSSGGSHFSLGVVSLHTEILGHHFLQKATEPG